MLLYFSKITLQHFKTWMISSFFFYCDHIYLFFNNECLPMGVCCAVVTCLINEYISTSFVSIMFQSNVTRLSVGRKIMLISAQYLEMGRQSLWYLSNEMKDICIYIWFARSRFGSLATSKQDAYCWYEWG